MLADVLGAVASIFLLCWSLAAQPDHASCPAGWWLPEGVRPAGSYVCRPRPIGPPMYRDARGVVHDPSVQPPGMIAGVVWCPPGRPRAATDDGVSVRCVP